MRNFLDTEPISLTHLPSIDESLKAFRSYIQDYRQTLNDEGIWLFLSTVGCWGVPNPIFQISAYILTMLIFGERLRVRHTENRSFSAIADELEKRITDQEEGAQERTRQLLILEHLRNAHMRGLRPFRNIKIFATSWIFYGASFAYTLHLSKT
jgi:hypothetical protein